MKTVRRQPARVIAHDRTLLAMTAVAAGAGAIFTSGAASGLGPADLAFRVSIAVVVTLAAARARLWTSLVLAATAFAVAQGWLLLPAGAALLVSFVATARDVRLRLPVAVAAALSIQVLLRQPTYAFHGASSMVTAAAVVPMLLSAHSRSRVPARQRQRRVLAGLTCLALVTTTAFAVALILARHDLETGARQARAALTAAQAGDATTARAELDDAAVALRHSAALTDSWWATTARAVPLVGQQAAAVSIITAEGREVIRSARTTAGSGDFGRLKYRTGRFDVSRLRQLRGPIADSAATLERADRTLAKLDRSWLVAPLQSRLDEFSRDIARAAPEADLASSVVDMAPGLLGGDGPRHYFVAFITPAELRGAGGFIGNYGELTAANGRIRLTRSGAITQLVHAAPNGKRRLTGPADYLRRYGSFAPADYFQDLTFSPQFPFDAEAIEQLYPQSGGTPLDGVISIDPIALAALLRFTGPITVPGLATQLTSTNAADILLRQQYVRYGSEATRKDLLVEASRITFDKLTTGNLPAPQDLARVLGPMVDQRRIMLHSTRPAEQRMFARMHADGALPRPASGDVLSIAGDNSGNNKIDTYLHRSISYDAVVNPLTGGVEATETVAVRNDAPASGLPANVIGNAAGQPAGMNLMSLSVYSPLGLRGATLDGRSIGMLTDHEAGLRVYSVRLRIPSGATQILRLDLAGALDLQRGYRLTASPQPVANPDRLTVSVRPTAGWQLDGGSGMRLLGPGGTSRATSGVRALETPSAFILRFRRR